MITSLILLFYSIDLSKKNMFYSITYWHYSQIPTYVIKSALIYFYLSVSVTISIKYKNLQWQVKLFY